MLDRIHVFSDTQAEALKQLEERQSVLTSRMEEIEDRWGTGLRSRADNKISKCEEKIKDIDRSQNPTDDVYYITDDVGRAEYLERKAPLEAERDQAQAEVDALKLEKKEIKKQLSELDMEKAPLAVLQGFQNKLDENWPMVVAGESILKIAAEIGPDLIVAAIVPLFDAYMDCVDKLEPQFARKRKQNAKAFKADFDAFVEAGFNPEQAMNIVLARAKADTLTTIMSMVAASYGK